MGNAYPWIRLSPINGNLGDLVNQNPSGPLRNRKGILRDYVIGLEAARADGQMVKSGGCDIHDFQTRAVPVRTLTHLLKTAIQWESLTQRNSIPFVRDLLDQSASEIAGFPKREVMAVRKP